MTLLAIRGAQLKIFLWFAVNADTETTWKIYVIAHDLAEARRLVDRSPGKSPELSAIVERTKPQVFAAPWMEVNVSREGKGMSWCFGDKLS